jgi:16S rRNA (adenine1518-N6/adenine1519-N6)-dimethyltransferase
MDPAQPSATRALLRQYAIRPRKRLGQNFLCDGNVLDRIADEALGGASVPVLEIGAGLGALTLRLAVRSPSVTAVEVDRGLMPALQEVLTGLSNVHVLNADFLKIDVRHLLKEVFRGDRGVVAGNIPYGITTPILERLFQCSDMLMQAALLVQTEVADRLTARPGTREYGSLTLHAAYYGNVRRVLRVPRHLFIPAPDVDSTLVVFEPGSTLATEVLDGAAYERAVRAAFQQRRKTLANALAGAGIAPDSRTAAGWLEACGIAADRRGETLSPTEFAQLANYVTGKVPTTHPEERRTEA